MQDNPYMAMLNGIKQQAQAGTFPPVRTGVVVGVAPLAVNTGGITLSGADLLVNADLLPRTRTVKLQKNSEEIIKINKTIEDIAFQTNILALNAAVEAARAGVSGKGFAVVADEVRNLAAKSALAAKSTAELIDVSVKSVETGKRLTDSMAQMLSGVLVDAREIAHGAGEIQSASQEQSLSISHITASVNKISSVVLSNSSTAQQSAAASQELSAQARMLSNLASQFKLKNHGVSAFEPAQAPQAAAKTGAVSSKY